MATVYLARDVKLDRAAAIKVLDPEVASAIGVERFLREIRFAARLQHPHILSLYDSGEAAGFLYYVMPYVAGESLRQRLQREQQLPLPDAFHITREVAEALDYAHAHGVLHRDVKPENILLAGGHAFVADFGVSRALAGGEDQLTKTGLTVGTPGYMSPEQATAAARIDGRSDLYSLGCVLYEMLSGGPPFTGTTPQAILARHLADAVPPLRTVRPTVPRSVERAILRALAKVPADRYRTVAEFAAAVAAPSGDETTASLRPVLAALATAAALVGVWIVSDRSAAGRGAATEASVDTSRYVILPFLREAGLPQLGEGELLHDALTRWSGIAVVDPFQVRDALARRGAPVTSGSDARAVAVGLGAGRYVRGEVSRLGDSLRVYAGLYDATRGGALLRDGTVKLGDRPVRAESAFAALGDRLLFGSEGPGTRLEARTGTTSLPARQAFARGQAAVYTWDLPAADSGFATATRYDPDYAQAFLWLAQVRSWSGAPTATWQSAAERAAAGRERLSSRDRLLSDALLALGRGAPERACPLWMRLTTLDPYDFATWYGLGTCVNNDDEVLRDSTSPTGWRFRTSYNLASRAYQRAFQLLPSMHKAVSGGSYSAVRRLLVTSGSTVRFGRAVPPDTTTFAAYPSWHGDSLAFVPYPVWQFSGANVVPTTLALAVRHERERFRDIATGWATAFPQSAEAIEALAISLEMLGDPAALDTLRRARTLARTADGRIRLAGAEVWMRVKFSVPSDVMGVRAARQLADSVLALASQPGAPEPLMAASLAALTGHATLAARLSQQPGVVQEWEIPAPLARIAGPLLTFAVLGGPLDSLRALERQADSVIDRHLAMPQQRQARLRWLARPATLAFPSYRFESLSRLEGAGDYLVDLEAAFLRGDTAGVRRVFAELRVARASALPADLTFDGLYPESWLLAALGDPAGAIAWLQPTLAALPASAPQLFQEPSNAGALIQAMALRAELAARVGDPRAATRWADVVAVLWSDADPFLQPVVLRMQRLKQ